MRISGRMTTAWRGGVVSGERQSVWKAVRRSLEAFRASPWGEALEIVGLALLIATFLRAFVVQPFYIPSRSMAETLLPLDHILTEKVTPLLGWFERGEIIVFDGKMSRDLLSLMSPAVAAEIRREEGPREFVKRIVGLPGDHLSLKKGIVYVNGKPWPCASGEPYRADFLFRFEGEELQLRSGRLWIDGRPIEDRMPTDFPVAALEGLEPEDIVDLGGGEMGLRSLRVPKGYVYVLGDNARESVDSRYFGFVRTKEIRGRVLATYWPLGRMRLL